MRKHLNWDRGVAAASWLIVATLAYATFFVLFGHLNPNGPIIQLIGVPATRIVISCIYAIQAGLLGWAKFFKKDTMRRHVLLFIYLTGFFFLILGIAVNGLTPRLIGNAVLSICAAICWLYWKLRTDYYTVEETNAFMKNGVSDETKSD